MICRIVLFFSLFTDPYTQARRIFAYIKYIDNCLQMLTNYIFLTVCGFSVVIQALLYIHDSATGIQ